MSTKPRRRAVNVGTVPNSRREPRYHVGETVKLIMVIDGQGNTLDPDDNELLLREHIGETSKILVIDYRPGAHFLIKHAIMPVAWKPHART
jgi:hypothetical protein